MKLIKLKLRAPGFHRHFENPISNFGLVIVHSFTGRQSPTTVGAFGSTKSRCLLGWGALGTLSVGKGTLYVELGKSLSIYAQ